MTPTHHPGEAWLLDYALGHLSELHEAVLRAHVSVCSACRERIAFAERLGGEFLRALPAEPMHFTAADVCDHHEQAIGGNAILSRAHTPASGDIEEVVATWLDSSLEALPWRRLGRGLALCRLGETDDARMWLLRGAPGTVLPTHTHAGSELTLVLKGAYFCGNTIYGAGDLEDADESTEHQPVITRDGECICLAVTEGRLRFRDWAPRLLQPFVGI
ncbi:MAG: ChrR family anti-sigma-E factor [Gammaproteobacteria bacterium]